MSIPPPPPDMFEKNFKNIGFDFPTRSSRKPRSKKTKPPLDSYEWYFFVGINAEGEVDIRSSSNAKRWKHEVMRTPASELLEVYHANNSQDEIVAGSAQRNLQLSDGCRMAPDWPGQPHMMREPFAPEGSTMSYSIGTNAKRKRLDSQSPEPQTTFTGPLADIRTTRGPQPHDSVLTNLHNNSTQPQAMIRLDEEGKWARWFTNAFVAIQQQACRTIAKEWIKLIHPKKQSTHPYNGNMPRSQKASPHRTKPPYWPDEVIHKEPDHINKVCRTQLLVHLLLSTPHFEYGLSNSDNRNGKEFRAAQFYECLEKTKQEELKDKWEIIRQIIECRTKLEEYAEGCCDGHLVMAVTDYQDPPNKAVNNKNKRGRPKPQSKTYSDDLRVDQKTLINVATPASPTGSTRTLLVESDNEDDMSLRTTSFSSAVTQASSRSSAPTLRPRPRPEPQSNNRHPTHLANHLMEERDPMLLDPGPIPMNVDYNHEYMSTCPAPTEHSWPVTTTTDSRIENEISNPGMSQLPGSVIQYDPSGYAHSQSYHMHQPMHIPAYHVSHGYPYGYPEGSTEMRYRVISDTGQAVHHDHQMQMLMHTSQAFHNPRPPGT